ncbi:hypothetical protein BKA82DRAFT_4015980 [Pisolithus tinctorius]|nr:hypothetical protein BKA82DRAFT_4015980 [Pisolithus tinctorius]
MDWPIFRDEGYLELTGQGEGSCDGHDISHHVPPELDTRINCYNISTINTMYHPPSVNAYHLLSNHPPSVNVYYLPSMDISYPPTSLVDPLLIFAPHEIEQLTENPHHPELGTGQTGGGKLPEVRNLTMFTLFWIGNDQFKTQPSQPTNTPELVPVNLQPTATMHIPDHVMKCFKDKAEKEHLAIHLAEGIFRSSGKTWLDSKKNMKTFCDNAKHKLHEVTSMFKTIARLNLKDLYNLHMPINASHMTQITETWRTSLEPLLIRWDFVDEEVLFPTGQTVTSFFNCHAVRTIIHKAVFLPCHKLSSVIPPDTDNLNHLITFTITIIWWGLTNLVRGHEAEFKADIYKPHYNNAL